MRLYTTTDDMAPQTVQQPLSYSSVVFKNRKYLPKIEFECKTTLTLDMFITSFWFICKTGCKKLRATLSLKVD
jgi:hypothetical protein